MHRREFLQFLGRTSAGLSIGGGLNLALLSCSREPLADPTPPLVGLKPGSEDELVLLPGLQYEVLLKSGDEINSRGELFGTDNDFTAFLPLKNKPDEALLWVNHEEFHALLFHDFIDVSQLQDLGELKPFMAREQQAVGGSIVHIKKGKSGFWQLADHSPYNRRLTARTEIPFHLSHTINGSARAIGTLANCAGGVTPWQTVLSCEENYDGFYGDALFTGGRRSVDYSHVQHRWQELFPYPPEHYGWVVEVDPLTGRAKKLVSLGRFSHEGATVVQVGDGRCVVYMGEDEDEGCVYKFIADRPGSLDHGTLYVANVTAGRWLPISLSKNTILRAHFTDEVEVMVRTREAARLVGGSGLDRPEDVEWDRETGAVFVCLTGAKKDNPYGSIAKVTEREANPLSLEFSFQTWKAGSEVAGFACPDNLAFDGRGNLWMTCDVHEDAMNKSPYKKFGNNGLFLIPLKGPHKGQVIRVATAPSDAEFTGPSFSSDGNTLFLSVQHPGARSRRRDQLTSHWPDGGDTVPRSAVVMIMGPFLSSQP